MNLHNYAVSARSKSERAGVPGVHLPLRTAQPRTVALTFDDLPAVGMKTAEEARSINLAILKALARHHAPAIGFVIESKLQEIGTQPGAKPG